MMQHRFFSFFSPGAWYANRCHNRTRMWVLYSPPLAPTLFWSNASHVLRIRVRSFSFFLNSACRLLFTGEKQKRQITLGWRKRIASFDKNFFFLHFLWGEQRGKKVGQLVGRFLTQSLPDLRFVRHRLQLILSRYAYIVCVLWKSVNASLRDMVSIFFFSLAFEMKNPFRFGKTKNQWHDFRTIIILMEGLKRIRVGTLTCLYMSHLFSLDENKRENVSHACCILHLENPKQKEKW